MTEPNYYAVIPANVRYDKSLSSTAKILYGEISALSNLYGYCFAANSYFAELFDISARQVITIIGDLEEKGYIRTERQNNSRKIFITDSLISNKNSNESSTEQDCSQGSEENFTGGVKKTSQGSEENFTTGSEENFSHNNTSINNKNNNIYTSEFEEWYKAYPKRWNKEQTFKNWKNALKKYSVKELFTALANYKAYIQAERIETKYITRSTNFLGRNAEFIGWLETENIEQEQQPPEKTKTATAEYDDEYQERLRRFGNVY